jgi:hypothetical protein
MRRAAILVLCAVLLAGCYLTRPVRVAELRQVNDSYMEQSGPSYLIPTYSPASGTGFTTARAITYSKLTFHEPDGTPYTVRGQAGLVITTVDGHRLRFDPGVRVEEDGAVLRITARNQTAERRADEERGAEVRWIGLRRTILVTLGASLAFGAAVIGATTVLTSDAGR